MFDIRAKSLSRVLIVFFATLPACIPFGGAQQKDPSTIGVEPSIRPADDFYGYANDVWIRSTPLPDGLSRLDTTSVLRTKNARLVEGLIRDTAKAVSAYDLSVQPDVQKMGDYFAGRLDTAAIEAKGVAPLSSEFAAIASITDRRALATYLGRTLRLDDGANQQTESLWGMWVHQDFHDADHYAAHFVQGGLGLARQGDYLESSSEVESRRAFYRAHIANLFSLVGFDDQEARATNVLEMEIAIARTHASRADTDDVFKTDNSWRHADFPVMAPGLEWDAYFSAAGLDPVTRFVVWQPQSVIGGAQLVASQSLAVWKDYLAFHLITHYADVLPQAIGDERRAFDARLSGATSSTFLSREQQAIAATEAAFGDAIGRLYVERHFALQSKAAATAMVENLRAAYRERLSNVSWMVPETKLKALAKLATLKVGLGYPDTWIDYSQLTIVRDDAFGNLRRAEAFAYNRELAKLKRAVDTNEWAGQLHPQMVGAILNISPNSMQFAAGLLQPPYFDPMGDAAANYGSAGAGIAHEISHSFDQLGNLYDEQGGLGLWWTDADLTGYRATAERLAAQLDACCPSPGACGHGKQVLSESASDLAGLAVAHDAYLLSLNGRPDLIKHGLTGEQRFFVAFAQRWRRVQTDAARRRQIETDNHAPPACRSNLVRNAEAWVNAFDVRPGDKLYLEPESRIEIW